MVRILLPLAVIAALLFAPIFGNQAKVGGIEKEVSVTGYDYVSNTIDCWQAGKISIKGDCKPQEGLKGQAVLAALIVSGAAAILGVFGLLPIIGRLTSVVTTIAGAVIVGAVGYVALTQLGDGGDNLRWGAYLAGGGGLLTLISGLHGMRGR